VVVAQFEIAYHEGHELTQGNAHTLKTFVILRAFVVHAFLFALSN
jgi:hypothetical protein